MIKRLLILAALGSVSVSSPAQKPDAESAGAASAKFGVREAVQHIDLSPDGRRVVYLTPGGGRVTSVYVTDLAGKEQKLVLQSSGSPERLAWCNFVSNDRLVCRYVGLVNDAGVLVGFARLIAVDADGGNVKQLGQRSSLYDSRIRQFDGDILDWLPDDDGAVLMARDYVPETNKLGTNIVRTSNGLGVDRIDVRTMKTSRVESPNRATDFYISDGRGTVRMRGYRPVRGGVSGLLSSKLEYYYRIPGAKDWTPFSTVTDTDGLQPLAVDASTNSVYALKRLDGRQALYRVKLDGTLATELIYKNDKVDVDDVVRVGRGGRVIGLTFAEEKRSVVYFDPEYRKLASALGKAIPNLPIIQFASASRDNSKLLIFAGSDSDPGRYYVYDKSAKTLNETMLARPDLEGVKLASVTPISYPAADGTPIPAYLTIPPGWEGAKNLPAVVLPHGGPSARDEWGFDWLAQFLAHQGYAVLQPNYRGSAGFGDAWLKINGFRSWQTSIGDVTAAGKWLTAQGIADPRKLAIVGWSYGGYAALQSGVTEPDLYKAIVAIAPVTDLDLVKQEARAYTNSQLVAEEIGSGPHVVAGSPLRNVARIKAPVLLFHGDLDLNVGIAQSRGMDSRLRAAGKKSELIEYPGLEHSLDDSAARVKMLEKISTFLDSVVGK